MGRLDLLLLVVWGRFGSGLTAGLRPVDGERPRGEWTEGLGERVTEREEEDFGEGVAGGGMHATPGRGVLTTCPSSKQESWEAGTISTSRDEGGPERRTPGRTKPPRPRWNPQGSQADHTRITYVNIFLFIFLFVNITAGASTTYTIYTIYNNTGFFALILTIYNIRTELKGRLGPFTSVSNNRPWDLWVIHRHTLHRRGRQRRTLGFGGGVRRAPTGCTTPMEPSTVRMTRPQRLDVRSPKRRAVPQRTGPLKIQGPHRPPKTHRLSPESWPTALLQVPPQRLERRREGPQAPPRRQPRAQTEEAPEGWCPKRFDTRVRNGLFACNGSKHPCWGTTVALCPRSLQILQIRGCPRNQSLQIVPAIKRLRGGSRSNSTLTRRVPVATPGCPGKCCIRTLLTSPCWARASLTASFDCSNGR